MNAKNQPAMHIPDSAVYAFHSALSDAALGESEFAEIKTGLAAAFAQLLPSVPLKTEGPWKLGEPDGGWVDIDYRDHGGYAKAVWRMEDDERSPDCEALARSMVASLNAVAAAIPVAEVCLSGDSAEFGERALRPLADIDSFEYGTVLYALPEP